jgi:hypothetical protein
LDQGREGKGLSGSPVDILSRGDALGSSLENLLDKSVEVACLGKNGHFLTQVLNSIDIDTCELFFLNIILLKGLPLLSHPILSLILKSFTLDVSFF